jgi:hypothetical protein
MAECPSRFQLALFRTKELPDDERAALSAHLEGCEECGRAVEALDANAQSYEADREAHLSALMTGIDKDEAPPPKRRFSVLPPGGISVFGGLAAAAVVLILVLVATDRSEQATEQEQIRFKGNVSLEVVAKRGDRQFRVAEGARLAKNDALRFVITTASAGYLHLFSLDEQGEVSSFYPESDPASDPSPMPILTAGRHELPGSVVLDDTLGMERFVLVFSSEPFDRAEVLRFMTADADQAGGGDDDKEFASALDIQILSITKEKKSKP